MAGETRRKASSVKFSADIKAFTDAVTTASVCARERGSLVITKAVLVRASKGRIELASTDLNTSCETTCEASLERDGEAAIDAKELRDLLGRIDGGEISIETEGQVIVVRQRRSRYRLHYYLAQDYPQIARFSGPKDARVDVPGSAMAWGLKACLPAASREMSRESLCAVRVVLRGGRLVAEATDGHRAHRYSMACEGSLESSILPALSVPHIARLCGSSGEVSLYRQDRLWVHAGETVYSTKLVDAIYPDFDRVIPGKRKEARITADRETLLSLVRRASFAGGPLVLQLADGELHLQCDGAESSAAEVLEAVEIDGAQQEKVGVNAAYLADAMKACPSDRVVLRVAAGLDPVVIQSDTDAVDFVAVIMPMRV